jgi:tight adherence protein B
VEDALLELDRRMDSPDLHIVITAFLVQREVGGNLAEILGNVAATMRERAMLRQELEALTSQQRFATWVVSAVPPIILVALALMNPGLVTPMFHHTAGWIVLGTAALLELTGVLVLRWMVSSFEV